MPPIDPLSAVIAVIVSVLGYSLLPAFIAAVLYIPTYIYSTTLASGESSEADHHSEKITNKTFRRWATTAYLVGMIAVMLFLVNYDLLSGETLNYGIIAWGVLFNVIVAILRPKRRHA